MNLRASLKFSIARTNVILRKLEAAGVNSISENIRQRGTFARLFKRKRKVDRSAA